MIKTLGIISQLDKNELKVIIENLQTQRKNQKLDFLSFLNEYNRVIKFFELINNLNDKGNTVHFLSNMALLGGIENTKLSNSVFEVKRKKILQMDASGSYIPLCTKNVFLKYHNVNEENFAIQQLYFWGENDRKNYLAHINDVLSEYLTIEMLSPIAENINLELETE